MNNISLSNKLTLLMTLKPEDAEKLGKELISQFILNKDKHSLAIICKHLGRNLYTYYINLLIEDFKLSLK